MWVSFSVRPGQVLCFVTTKWSISLHLPLHQPSGNCLSVCVVCVCVCVCVCVWCVCVCELSMLIWFRTHILSYPCHDLANIYNQYNTVHLLQVYLIWYRSIRTCKLKIKKSLFCQKISGICSGCVKFKLWNKCRHKQWMFYVFTYSEIHINMCYNCQKECQGHQIKKKKDSFFKALFLYFIFITASSDKLWSKATPSHSFHCFKLF